MQKRKYTDKDVQDWLDGNFTGDRKDFETALQNDNELLALHKFYKKMLGMIEPEALNYNLAESVIEKLQAEKKLKEVKTVKQFNVLTTAAVMMIVIAVVYLLIILIPLLPALGPLLFGFVLIVFFSWMFYQVEMERKRMLFDV